MSSHARSRITFTKSQNSSRPNFLLNSIHLKPKPSQNFSRTSMATCLYLGVDLQQGFLNDDIQQSDYIERVEKYLTSLPKGPVVLTRFVNSQTSAFAKYL